MQFGRSLLKLPLFKNHLDRYHAFANATNQSTPFFSSINQLLSKKAVDVIKSLTTDDPLYKSLVNFMVQLAVIDVLKVLGVEFSKILAVSFGEILAAYYKSTITLNEAVSLALTLEKLTNQPTNNKTNSTHGN